MGHPLDYGSRRRPRVEMDGILAVGGFVIAAVLILGLAFVGVADVQARIEKSHDTARTWMVEGPPCPALPPGPSRSRYGIELLGLSVGRRYGHAECRLIWAPDGRKGPICQFTKPSELEVSTPAGHWRFTTDVGHPATVSLLARGDEEPVPQCVLAASFDLYLFLNRKLGPAT